MRVVARIPNFKDIGQNQLVLLPEKPPATVCHRKRNWGLDVSLLGDSFLAFDVPNKDGEH